MPLDPNTVRMRNDQVLLEYDAPKEEKGNDSLIFKPQSRNEIKFRGTVLSVGPGKMVLRVHECGCPAEYIRKPVDLKVGDRVIFEMGAGTLLDEKYPGQHLLICTEEQITAVVESDAMVLGDADTRDGVRLFSRTKLTGHA